MAVRPVAETIDHDASFNDALEMPFRELERYCARNALAEAVLTSQARRFHLP